MRSKYLLIMFVISVSLTNANISSSWIPKKIAGICGTAVTAFGIHYVLQLAHELGHYGSALALIAARQERSNTGRPTIDWIHPFPLILNCPEFKRTANNIIVDLSGPVCGLLGTYCLLKLANVYTELLKKKKPLDALRDGMRKNCINTEQPRVVHAVAGLHGAANLMALYPFETDGHRIVRRIWPDK